MSVVLVDAGGTNIGSVRYALGRLGVEAPVTADPAQIRAADHVILPGVGAAPKGMQRLRDAGLDALIPTLTQPVLGVCLGMQLLYDSSAEGDVACLGILSGTVQALHAAPGRRIPHMGWNALVAERDDPLLAGIEPGAQVYFVHGYGAPCTADTVASTEHGQKFAALARHGNFCGMQFHPERSGRTGARLLQNFLAS